METILNKTTYMNFAVLKKKKITSKQTCTLINENGDKCSDRKYNKNKRVGAPTLDKVIRDRVM